MTSVLVFSFEPHHWQNNARSCPNTLSRGLMAVNYQECLL